MPIRRKEFTSEIAGDSNRGVVDTTHQGSAEFHYRLSDAAIMTLGVQRIAANVNVTSRGVFQYQYLARDTVSLLEVQAGAIA